MGIKIGGKASAVITLGDNSIIITGISHVGITGYSSDGYYIKWLPGREDKQARLDAIMTAIIDMPDAKIVGMTEEEQEYYITAGKTG